MMANNGNNEHAKKKAKKPGTHSIPTLIKRRPAILSVLSISMMSSCGKEASATIQKYSLIPNPAIGSRQQGRRSTHLDTPNSPRSRRPLSLASHLRQRVLDCSMLVLFYVLCQSTTNVLEKSSCSLHRLSSESSSRRLPILSNGAFTGSDPRSAKEYFLRSFASSFKMKSNSFNIDRSILSEDDPNRPILVLYVGVPEEPPYLQCALCTQSQLTKSLGMDNFVYLGTCPYECDQFISPNASNSQTLNEGHYYVRGNPRTFFTSGFITEPRAENTTLGIVPHTLQMSQAHGRRRNIPQLEVDFMLALDAVRHSGRNALLIHPGASMWGAKHIRSLSAFLKLHHWQVHVMIGPYRPLHEYHAEISYAYVHHNFLTSYGIRLWPNMQSGDQYLGWETLHDSTLNDLEDLLRESFQFNGHPMEIVRHNYGRHFPRTHYVAAPTSASDRSMSSSPSSNSQRALDTMQHMFCVMLGLNQACSAVIQLKDLPTPPSAPRTASDTWDQLQLDAMAVQAWEIGWLPASLAQRGSRLTVRRHLEAHVQQHNVSVKDFPLTCWNKKTLWSMQNMSCHFERRIVPSKSHGCLLSNSSVASREARGHTAEASSNARSPFPRLVDPHLYCYVNVNKLFQDRHWKSFFESLPTQSRRPQDDDEEDFDKDDEKESPSLDTNPESASFIAEE